MNDIFVNTRFARVQIMKYIQNLIFIVPEIRDERFPHGDNDFTSSRVLDKDFGQHLLPYSTT